MTSLKTLRETVTSTKRGLLVWQQERTILEITELICALMERDHFSRAELARRLKKSRGYVSQLLDGGTNMTARTISDVLTVLGYELRPEAVALAVRTRERRRQRQTA